VGVCVLTFKVMPLLTVHLSPPRRSREGPRAAAAKATRVVAFGAVGRRSISAAGAVGLSAVRWASSKGL